MFVMYLGNKDASSDYIGMAVVDGQLTCVYNLGERVAELQVDQILTESETREAVMDQFARHNYTKEATTTGPKHPSFMTWIVEVTTHFLIWTLKMLCFTLEVTHLIFNFQVE
ncbi:PREDICTED: laminin subunit alpha-3-like [Chinchilla lanigera]|uniref:laminin subunit alpha-3-like n=1 Tax=Chinchilla lanigera TaxID=34839 RepID=UPI0006977AE9|nr:PREDICTED: laminin subunit alpha-3-like [Chinchilla lanigera]